MPVRMAIGYEGTVEDYKLNLLTGGMEAHVRLARHPSVVVAVPVASSFRSFAWEELPPSEASGNLAGDAS